MKTLLYIWFFGVHGRYIRVMDLFTNVYSSINVPELLYPAYNRHPVDRQRRHALKRFIPAAIKTEKFRSYSTPGHIRPIFYAFFNGIPQTFFWHGGATQRWEEFGGYYR
jgi:hypothetical protein